MSGFPATAITPEMVAALEAAVMTGALEVSWDSGGVRQKQVYQSTAAMITALNYARDRLNDGVAALQRTPSTLAVFERD